jgi:nucleotide-binding universal stress UspA family protein
MTEDALFKKILIATDGSEKNRSALDEGLRIARACGSVVYAVYVIDMSAFSSTSGEIPMGDTYRMLEEEGRQAMSRVQALAGDVSMEMSVLEGRPATEIVELAKTKDVDLLVIGTHGKKGLERLLLGSVAESVIRSAPCKVLVVK